jgi:hypothetical protein
MNIYRTLRGYLGVERNKTSSVTHLTQPREDPTHIAMHTETFRAETESTHRELDCVRGSMCVHRTHVRLKATTTGIILSTNGEVGKLASG